jgi:hypothetical protein
VCEVLSRHFALMLLMKYSPCILRDTFVAVFIMHNRVEWMRGIVLMSKLGFSELQVSYLCRIGWVCCRLQSPLLYGKYYHNAVAIIAQAFLAHQVAYLDLVSSVLLYHSSLPMQLMQHPARRDRHFERHHRCLTLVLYPSCHA